MPYAPATVEAVERSPRGLHKTLARAAIRVDLPITQVAQAIGATRWTVYRWFKGNEVSPAYRQRVTEVALILEKSADKEQAWKNLRVRFSLDP
jgi:plasmid maintenance system antidote protein VapI